MNTVANYSKPLISYNADFFSASKAGCLSISTSLNLVVIKGNLLAGQTKKFQRLLNNVEIHLLHHGTLNLFIKLDQVDADGEQLLGQLIDKLNMLHSNSRRITIYWDTKGAQTVKMVAQRVCSMAKNIETHICDLVD